MQRERSAADFPQEKVLPVGGIDQAGSVSGLGPLNDGLDVDLQLEVLSSLTAAALNLVHELSDTLGTDFTIEALGGGFHLAAGGFVCGL